MKLHLCFAGALLLLLATSVACHAQDIGEDDDEIDRAADLLSASADLHRQKRRHARETQQWVANLGATAAVGYDSNVHESPNDNRNSTFESVSAELEGRRYFGKSHRLKFDLGARRRRYQESLAASPSRLQIGAFYGYRPDANYSLSLSGSVKRRNDSATTIRGLELARNFAYTAYRSSASLWLYGDQGRALRLSYSAQRRDFVETQAQTSLDWWRHGPELSYRKRWDNGLRWELSYAFSFQSYDEEPAGNRFGAEPPGVPAERHHFHNADTELDIPLAKTLEIKLRYDFDRKDDRYQDFESYIGHSGKIELEWIPVDKWGLHTSMRYRKRDYDNRPGSLTRRLQYDRWTALVLASYQLSRHFTLFASYEIDYRDTNRIDIGNTFRDYLRHLVVTGVSAAY